VSRCQRGEVVLVGCSRDLQGRAQAFMCFIAWVHVSCFICTLVGFGFVRLCVLVRVKTMCYIVLCKDYVVVNLSISRYLVLSMQMHSLLHPLLLHIWCWFMCVRGSYEANLCVFAFKGKNKLCIHLGGAQLHFMNFCELNCIYLANSCVVIKHQKGGD
jgi:hypothetical protein